MNTQTQREHYCKTCKERQTLPHEERYNGHHTEKGTYTLSDLLDVPRLQELLDALYEMVAIPSAILDADGTVLTATGWQDICIKFHRVHAKTNSRCCTSDAYITEHLNDRDREHNYVAYECANGLVDVASPIIVDGKLLGSVFTGQFLYEPPDIERFRWQAQQFGFDEEAYLEALARVPIIPRDQVKPILHYLSLFTNMLTDIGAQQLRQYELEHEHIALQEQVIDAQRSVIRELSTPLIPLSDTVVLMPLVGSIDSQRAQIIMDVLLEGVAAHQAHIAIMDITGVQVVDTQVANALIQAAHAVKLLGAETILTGIGPTMAQTLVHLGIDLSTLITKGSLQAGIAQALNGINRKGTMAYE